MMMCVKCAIHYRIRQKKYRGNTHEERLDENFRYQIANTFKLTSKVMNWEKSHISKQAMTVLKQPFLNLLDKITKETMIGRVIIFGTNVKFIQRRMREKVSTSDAKGDLIENRWDRVVFELNKVALKTKDVGMQAILSQISLIRPKVKRFVFDMYVRQCRMRGIIAFMQWRRHFSTMRKNNGRTTQMADEEIDYMINHVKKWFCK